MVLSITGQVMLNTGLWVILDEKLWESTWLRNGIYMFVGMLLLLASDGLWGNAGVYPWEEEDDEEDESEDEETSLLDEDDMRENSRLYVN